MSPEFTRPRGATITIGLLDDGATPGGVALITAYARTWSNRLRGIDPAGTAIRFLPSYRAEATVGSITIGKGWNLSLDAGNCAAMPLARYQLDAKVVDGQGVAAITESAFLTIVESATTLPVIAPATPSYPDPAGIVVPIGATRTLAWILDPPLSGSSVAAIMGATSPSGSGGGGAGLGTPVVRTATTGGAQAITAFAGTNALVFVNGLLLPPALFSITADTLTISAPAGIVNGDQIVAYPI